ncbi:alkaline phosphatase [Chitinophaga rhizosphaerae]|uniref:alkaline phosphatase n=1 Tax=Chitinophaga rhizosphaerae TaxID=1864947 RepID=UPI000F7FB866|nr:alkaline phosphatase [Chitinophaga rhizosphaerae]
MRHTFTFLLLFLGLAGARAQYTAGNAHSHNDYAQAVPFEKAFSLNFGSIEADVFLLNGVLYVAHMPAEIDTSKTLRKLYLEPLREKVLAKAGVFGETKQYLQILIDFKTAAAPTMDALLRLLREFPELMNNPKLEFTISGNRPPQEQWASFPACIRFDGRPGVTYTAAALKKVALISDNFRNYTKWNGKGILVTEDLTRIEKVIAQAHAQGKKFRFWATPDDVNTWKTMIKLGVDYINTDKTGELANYLRTRVQSQFQADSAHAVYQPAYRNNDQLSKVKNVILLIGDGMGLAQIYSGYTGNFGKLNLFGMLNIGFSKTSSSDSYITDSAAGGTAMASGKKTKNRSVGVDSTGAPIPSIADLIAPLGMKSALISSGDMTDATPAAFYGHTPERDRSKEIALGLLESPVSILIGAGQEHFEGMWETLRNKGYTIEYRLSSLDTIRRDKYIVLSDSAQLRMAQGRGAFLTKSLKAAINTLERQQKGFFIMEEAAQIDWGGHVNSVPYLTSEMLDFDQAIGEAMRFADSNGETLVIVTADHETGGLTLLDGDISKGYVDGHFSTNDHTGVMVPVFAYGPHSLDFRGVYENTAIFEKIMQILRRYQN